MVVTSKESMPRGRHWVIIKFSSVYVPGDERSRTNPGHGYPAHSEPTVSYEAYTSLEGWEAAIRKLELSKREDYFAAEVRPAEVTVDTTVNVSR